MKRRGDNGIWGRRDAGDGENAVTRRWGDWEMGRRGDGRRGGWAAPPFLHLRISASPLLPISRSPRLPISPSPHLPISRSPLLPNLLISAMDRVGRLTHHSSTPKIHSNPEAEQL